MTVGNFAKKRANIFWSTKNPEKLSDSAIVEGVLNFGDFDDVKAIIKILGLSNVAKIFRRQIRQKRNNYRPEIKNYFKLYFNKYA